MIGLLAMDAEEGPPQFSLRWNNYQTNLTRVFEQHLQTQSFVDVTLACDGRTIKAHKMVLAACSPYFQTLFFENPCDHPIVILDQIRWPELEAVVEFMYRGEISIQQDQIKPLLKVAELLMVRGLADVEGELGTLKAPPAAVAPPPVAAPTIPAVRKESPVCLPKVRKRKHSPKQEAPKIETVKIEEKQTKIPIVHHDYTRNIAKLPSWEEAQLQGAIRAVVTQRMRFTQASTKFGIPKGTLYDNILGKSKRMQVLDEAGLSANEERAVLEFCCDVAASPYNRRTKRALPAVLEHVTQLRRVRDPAFGFSGLAGFRWWWAFCKKHSIVSLYFDRSDGPPQPGDVHEVSDDT